MSYSVQPHRWQPTRLPRPWDSPGKNTGVGCHFLLQCMKVKSESEVTQSCLTLSDPMDCSPLGSSLYGIFQARVLEWGAIAFSTAPLYSTFNKTARLALLNLLHIWDSPAVVFHFTQSLRWHHIFLLVSCLVFFFSSVVSRSSLLYWNS